jgi:aminomethyltransferase
MKTALYDHHVALGAKIVPFSGWEMPVHYQGVLAEHQAVRQAAGLFDVSHMGLIHVLGEDAEPFLDFLSTNHIKQKANHSVTYTVWCHEKGGAIDDVLIYKKHPAHFFVVVNAGNRAKDLAHLQTQATQHQWKVTIQDCFESEGILACQGPQAFALVASLEPRMKELKPMTFVSLEDSGCMIARTGYTGAGGVEIYGPHAAIIKWWEQLLEQGKSIGIQPVGLGARDTLRLEMGFALYGHELSDTIAPSESVSAWTVKQDKADFLGKQTLEQLEASHKKRYAYGVKLQERAIARQGFPVFFQDQLIGEVTSGSFSPTLEENIALILVNSLLQSGDVVSIQVRSTLCHAQVVNLPFVRKTI